MSDEQINTMQESVMHHERQINDLSEMVTAQWHEIDHLKKTIEKLNEKLSMVEDSVQEGGGKAMSVTEMAAQNKPPHY